MPGTLVAIATYNERGNLAGLVHQILEAIPCDILITDDSSPDGTGKVADELASGDTRIKVVHRPGKLGITSAHIAEFEYALREGYDRIVEMDGDFSHRPQDLPRVVNACPDDGIALGSRLIAGGRIESRSGFRDLLTRLGCLYARTVLRLRIRDCTGGFRCTSRQALQRIDLRKIRSSGFGFQLELNYAWHKGGVKITEVPIVFADRKYGDSKMTRRMIWEPLIAVLKLRSGVTPVALRPGTTNGAIAGE